MQTIFFSSWKKSALTNLAPKLLGSDGRAYVGVTEVREKAEVGRSAHGCTWQLLSYCLTFPSKKIRKCCFSPS